MSVNFAVCSGRIVTGTLFLRSGLSASLQTIRAMVKFFFFFHFTDILLEAVRKFAVSRKEVFYRSQRAASKSKRL